MSRVVSRLFSDRVNHQPYAKPACNEHNISQRQVNKSMIAGIARAGYLEAVTFYTACVLIRDCRFFARQPVKPLFS